MPTLESGADAVKLVAVPPRLESRPVHRRLIRTALLAALAAPWLAASAACRAPSERTAPDLLAPCQSADGPTDALCGRLDVFENRSARSGRTISLKIVVWPALSPDPGADPLVLSRRRTRPGRRQMARHVRDAFRASRPIATSCSSISAAPATPAPWSAASMTRRHAGVADRVRRRGPGPAEDLPGRLRRRPSLLHHPDRDGRSRRRPRLPRLRADQHLRRVVRHARGPRLSPAARRPRAHDRAGRRGPSRHAAAAYFARDAQRALDRLLADCAADAACAAKYPDLAERVRAAVRAARIRAASRSGWSIPAPAWPRPAGGCHAGRQSGVRRACIRRSRRRSSRSCSSAPSRTTSRACWRSRSSTRARRPASALGMQLSVTCAEDVPRIAPGDARAGVGRHPLRPPPAHRPT